MKYTFVLLLFTLFAPVQAVKAEILSLETVIEQALQNSPETARILNNLADAKAEAFTIETPSNPSAEINTTAIEDSASRSIGIEIEQPLRPSNFGSRRSYADALRRTANIEQKAQMLELIHSITRGYASYWALQEQEKILSENANYARKKQKLIERAAQDGRVDAADAKVFKAEALRLEEQLRGVQARKTNGAANLLRMAGMDQRNFEVSRPKSPEIPDLLSLTELAGKEGSTRRLLESRKALAERRYNVARQDALPEFAPRAVIERDFDEDSTAILFGVTIAIPIWDRNNAELSRARAERRLAQSNLNALNEQNFASVLAASFKQAKATQISASTYRTQIVPSWDEVQSITDKKFENGQASILDLFQMRERIVGVQNEALQTYLNSIEAQIELESLIGQSLTDIKELRP
ncbi:TolC family protein [Tunicatimonas pelagia]|uniref:TolC family protein n=1 Tax=Tunicatimonas pelagia TaxID=931531 RepID=UPI0026664E7D|nr:TolC family protein [Tunicatimonas pelagia]WKN45402.1 TolC family protein [Tunicatimonas pelagia]